MWSSDRLHLRLAIGVKTLQWLGEFEPNVVDTKGREFLSSGLSGGKDWGC